MSAHYLPDGSCEFVNTEGRRSLWKSAEDWAQAWLAEWRAESSGTASDFIHDMTRSNSEGAVAVLVVLARVAASNPDEICWVGAGPIEDLLAHDGHGAAVIDEVESAAATEPEFKMAIGSVWVGREIDPSVRVRLVALGARYVSA